MSPETTPAEMIRREGAESLAIVFRTLLFACGGALLLIIFSMLQKRLMGVSLSFTPRAFVVPVLFGGGSGLLLGIWHERLRRAMRLLSISEERYRTVTDFASDLTYLISPDGSLQYVSPSALKLTGYTAREFIEDPTLLDKIILDEDREIWVDHRSRHDQHGESEEIHLRIVTRNGDVRWVRHVCRPVTNERGEYLGIRGSNSDISEIKKAEDEIMQLNMTLESRIADRTASLEEATEELQCLNEDLIHQRESLERSNRDLEAFSYSVSHDLRAPLQHIIGFSSILERNCSEKLGDEERELIDRICNATVKMDRMIDSMLHLSRISTANICRIPVNLSEIATTIITMLRETNPERSVTVTIEPDLTTTGDRYLLENALQNLIANAWKYTALAKDAEIHFGREMSNGTEQFFIRDNGVGFDMTHADKLFGAFQRLHGNEFEGSGIGLATAKRIIERHGGRIWGEGKINGGAVFHFTLGSTSL